MKFILPLLLFFHLSTAQNPKVEPPHWWTGMKEPYLQLMITGKNAGNLKPLIKYPGIKMAGYSCPDNKDYLFIDLTIAARTKPGSFLIQLRDGDQIVHSIPYELQKRSDNSSQREGFSTDDVIYLITPDRFANGDPANDEISGMKEGINRDGALDRHGGDIEGIRQHMNYFKSLGVTALWLNPVLENDMPQHSYHGYAVTDFYKTDPRMGSNEDYRSLCKEATENGIKVIKDMIVNHCGLQHLWLASPPTKDWINYYGEEFIQTNHRKTLTMDPYASREDQELLTDGWFVKTMPDLNTNNKYLSTYLIQNSIWWIEFAGLAGIRMDTYLYPDESFMNEWSKRIMMEYPAFNIAGEVWHDNPYVVSYWQRPLLKKIPLNESHLPSLFDFPLQTALRKALTTDEVWDSGWMHLYETIAQDRQYPDPYNLVVFADNHDMSRIYTQVNEDLEKFKMALTYILTVRGIPQIYYGTEVLMGNKGTDNHGVIRSDFPGGWKGDKTNVFSMTGLSDLQKESYFFLQKLLHWRKTADVIHDGKMMHFVPRDGVYVYFRYNNADKVMVILNKNNEQVSLDLKRYAELIGASTEGEEIISGKKISLQDKLVLNGEGPMIIMLKQ